jgi:3-phenylpropionate/cinnamic acid dioxygenase small subunit
MGRELACDLMGMGNSHEQQIANLLFTYAEMVDAADFDGVGELFARAGYGVPGGLIEGRAVGELMRKSVLLHDGAMGTKHVTTNLLIDVDDAAITATCRSYFTVMQATAALPLQPVITGRYADRFARDEAGWYFVERLITIEQIGDVSHHLRRPLR